MQDIWATDSRVLNAVVQRVAVEGEDDLDFEQLGEQLDLSDSELNRALGRLANANMIDARGDDRRGWLLMGVTERGLRESGAWPDRADQLAAQLIAALAEAAEKEPEPEKRGKLKAAATGVAGVGREVLTDVIAAYAVKMSGGG